MAELNLHSLRSFSPRRIDDSVNTAAVIVPIVNRTNGHWILFTKRAENLGDHPGQMSFPGGRAEQCDESISATALRECQEEIGLEQSEPTVIGRLDDIQTVTEYTVTPFVATIPDRCYSPDQFEVAEVVTVSVDELLDPKNYECKERHHPEYGDIDVHYFYIDEYTIWGATGRILLQLLSLASDFHHSTFVNSSSH